MEGHRARWFVLVWVLAVFGPPTDATASHYAWLGHGAEAPAGARSLGSFVPTFYRILDEATPEWSAGERTEELLALNGQVLARVPPAFKKQLDIEGSARLRDGRIINIEDRVRGQQRYVIVRNAPFGLGAPGFKLIPYRTVAVDPRRIKLGTVLYVPRLVGIALPSGEIHDGFCFAHDTGHGIIGNRIDLFVGFESDQDNALTRSGRVDSHEPTQLYAVTGATAAALTARFTKDFTAR
ncbi:MAG: hypothetical protein HY216_17690 [Candidatus Rokubacteria bacterium]|nr:hypothetical protein [Candidatus Rokubacteria bacterium]